MRNRKRVGWHKYINGVTIATLVTAIFVLLPLYWLVASSFKSPNDVGNSPPQLFPNPVSTANYSNAFVGYDFGIYFRNSIIVTLCTTGKSRLLIEVTSRRPSPGRTKICSTMTVPPSR